MDEREQLDLERRLHAMMVGDAGDPDRRETLRRIARDPAARELLAEMLEVQDAARAAYGYDRTEPDITLGASRIANDPGVAARPPGSARPSFSARWSLAGRWAFRVAAAMTVAVSLFVAATARRQPGPAESSQGTPAAIDPAELDRYRVIWRQVADTSPSADPWVVLNNGHGEFGYLSERLAAGGGGVLLRCVVLGPDSQAMERLNVLIPAGQWIHLDLPDAGELAGEPVHCRISTDEAGASVNLTVGDDARAPIGVSGRVGLDRTSAEIGRFYLRGRPMRVVVQVVPLDTALG